MTRAPAAGRLRIAIALASALPAAACRGVQSALNPAGPQAASLDRLWWFMLGVCSAVFVCVIGFLGYALFRRRPAAESAAGEEEDGRRRMLTWVRAAVAVTVAILGVFLLVSVVTGRKLWSRHSPDALEISVTGLQWWWQVTYPQAQGVVTANEIHIPVGREVILTLTSHDVIHSFWAPNLNGKIDLIPGYVNTTMIRADRPGTYRGQCAEFCGYQHAHMGFLVIAESPEEFSRWLTAQRLRAAEPATPEQRRGRDVFLAGQCVMCHTIRGTGAAAQVAPDLTHVASRMTIAAATLPNNRGNLAGWVVDPQTIKPGNHMPANAVAPDQLQDLVSYLESLR